MPVHMTKTEIKPDYIAHSEMDTQAQEAIYAAMGEYQVKKHTFSSS